MKGTNDMHQSWNITKLLIKMLCPQSIKVACDDASAALL
jgi:hypothetical protein